MIEKWEYFVSDDLIHTVEVVNGNAMRSAPFRGRLAYIKRYVDLKIWFNILFHVGTRRNKRDLLAVIYNAGEDAACSLPSEGKSKPKTHRRNDSVLIDVAGLMDKPDGVRVTPIGSVIGLKALDECLGSGQDVPCLPPPVGPLSVSGRFLAEDGELRVAARLRRSQQGQLPCEMIERRAEVEEEITNDWPQGPGRFGINLKSDIIPPIHLLLYDQLIRVAVHISPQPNVKRAKVFLCPAQFCLGIIERMHEQSFESSISDTVKRRMRLGYLVRGLNVSLM